MPRFRTPVLGAFLEGWRRVLRAPALTAGILAATFIAAAPMALVIDRAIESHLGASLDADRAAASWHASWAAEFAAQARGIERTFTHEILGFGGTMAILGALADNESIDPLLATAVAAYLGLWIFLSGGILDRIARGRPVRTAAFFAACGVYFTRFLRLAVIVGAAYWVLFSWLHPYVFGTLYDRLTRDMTSERSGIALRVTMYVAFFVALALVNLVADFAKVRAVVEDRRGMLSALAASMRFIRRRFFRTSGLYLLNVLALAVILRLWLQAAPSADAAPWLALLIAQIYLLVRVWARLSFMASEVVFFQGDLAHAQYTAAPELLWPESPAAEAIDNLIQSSRMDR